ncbi:MAG: hypothetical protein KA791_03610 [Flavobacteriales bacterium]|nr:hypothetical protein [Flavobacteriales bacterium]
MVALQDITRMVGQVRSEMRITAAREMPKASSAFANEDLGRFEQSIRRFKFKLVFEERRDPEVQKAVRELHRLYEDLLHFFSQPGVEAPETDKSQPQLILTPVRNLSSLLANGH